MMSEILFLILMGYGALMMTFASNPMPGLAILLLNGFLLIASILMGKQRY